MDILISGSTGLVGKSLCDFLRYKGCRVVQLTRKKTSSPLSVFWDPQTGEGNVDDFEGFDAIIHLAGENIATGFWTQAKKDKVLKSRKLGTERLVSLIEKLNSPPKVFISASAVGYYGLKACKADESAPSGEGFLAEVCREWEAASKPLQKLGIRVVHTRLGTVLSPKGGILKLLLPLFRWGLGGKMGSGQQMMSWISLEDVVGAFFHILNCNSLKGPVNLVAPCPVTQEVFAKTLAKVLSRPCFLPLPRCLFIGEKAKELLFSSIEAVPSKLHMSNYSFVSPELEGALRRLL